MTCNSEHLSISIQTILSNRFGEDDDLLLVNKELVYLFLYICFLFVVFRNSYRAIFQERVIQTQN